MLNLPAIIAVLLINAVFSGSYLFGKIGVDHFPPFLFASLRFAIVALALAPFLRVNRSMLVHWRPILSFCLMMGVGLYATMYLALYLADGASAILVGTQLSTPIAILIGVWLLQEKASKKVWMGIGLTMLGVSMVGFDTVILGYPMAFFLIVLNAAFYAGANVTSRFLKDSTIDIFNLNAWTAIISTPLLILISWLSGESWQEPLQHANSQAWIALLYSSLAVSLIGHVGMFKMLEYYPIAAIMPYYVFTPIFGVIGAVIFLEESLTIQFVIGAIIAMIGLCVINIRWHKTFSG